MARKNTAYKVSDEITYPFTNFNGAQGSVVEQCITERATLYKYIFEKKSFHILLGIWFLIYTGIKVNPC